MKVKDYNLDWAEYFKIEESSPSGLIRIKDKYNKSINGYTAGSLNFRKNGNIRAWQLSFQKKSYLVHRIIWVLAHGSISRDMVIDHLDGDPSNNALNNLSLKTQASNCMNKRKYSNNNTEITGVCFIDNKQGQQYYMAFWNNNDGKREFKLFSINKLGVEVAKTLAISYREQQFQQLVIEGAEYTDRHGF